MMRAEQVSSRPLISARQQRILGVTVAVAILAACRPVSPTPTAAGGLAAPPPSAASGLPPSAAPAVAVPFDPARLVVGLGTVVGGLDAPLGGASAGEGGGRLFVTGR